MSNSHFSNNDLNTQSSFSPEAQYNLSWDAKKLGEIMQNLHAPVLDCCEDLRVKLIL